MREATIEKYLTTRIRRIGGLALKWTSPGMTGVPDRILILPGGRIAFAELKSTGRTERPRQVFVQKLLKQLGCAVYSSVDSFEKVDKILDELSH